MKVALRQLTKSPAFTLVALLTLTLGIGATTAIFSVIRGILLQPLPFAQPDRLVTLWEASHRQNFPKAPLRPGPFYDLQAETKSFEALSAWNPSSLNLEADGLDPERLQGTAVAPHFDRVLRVGPARGRFFQESDFVAGEDGAVLLSHSLWQQKFGGDPAIIGRTIKLNARARVVVGVMPDGFNYPAGTDAWIPYAPSPELKQRRDWHLLRPVGRLKAGIEPRQAQAELKRFAVQFSERHAATDADWEFNLFLMNDDAVSTIRPALVLLLLGAVALLLIACANVANLLLARAATRGQEIAIRVSLGATRPQIIRQLLAENLLLFALGGGGGALLARWLLTGLVALAPPDLPRLDQVRIDWEVLLFALGVALVSGLLVGVITGWQQTRRPINAGLRAGGRGTTASRGLLRPFLVVLQVSSAVALLVIAGLLIRSFERVRSVDMGFKPDGVLTFRLDLPSVRYDTVEKTSGFAEELARQLQLLPGVQNAGATTAVPLSAGPTFIMRIEGREPLTPSQAPVAAQRVATPDYFRAMGMSLLRGRSFGPDDRPGSPRVCLINQTLAQKYFPNENPVGKRLEIGFATPPAWREIVGVVADAKTNGLDTATPLQVFEPPHQWKINSFSFAVRTSTAASNLIPAIRATVLKLDSTLPVHTIKPMTQLVAESLAQRSFSLVLIAVFAGVALVLAAIGLYGVIAHDVVQRTKEFGVRLALGSTQGGILRLVLRDGLAVTALGLAFGLAVAWGTARLMASMLFEIGANDPLTFLATAAFVGTVALLAALIPAFRATRIDPIVALRDPVN